MSNCVFRALTAKEQHLTKILQTINPIEASSTKFNNSVTNHLKESKFYQLGQLLMMVMLQI